MKPVRPVPAAHLPLAVTYNSPSTESRNGKVRPVPVIHKLRSLKKADIERLPSADAKSRASKASDGFCRRLYGIVICTYYLSMGQPSTTKVLLSCHIFAFHTGNALLFLHPGEQTKQTEVVGYSIEMLSTIPFHQIGWRTVICAFSPFGNLAAAE